MDRSRTSLPDCFDLDANVAALKSRSWDDLWAEGKRGKDDESDCGGEPERRRW